LLKSNDALQKQVRQLQQAHKDNKRVQLITQLRTQLRESQALSDKFKTHLIQRGLTIDQVEQLVEEALNEPKRVRPRTTESWQRQVAEMKTQIVKLEKALHEALERGRVNQAGIVATAEASEEVQVLRAQLEAKESLLQGHKDMLASARDANRSLRRFQADFTASEERNAQLQVSLGSLQDKLVAAAAADEKAYQENRFLAAQLVKTTREAERRARELGGLEDSASRESEELRTRVDVLGRQVQLLKADLEVANAAAEWQKNRASELVQQQPRDLQALKEQLVALHTRPLVNDGIQLGLGAGEHAARYGGFAMHFVISL